jgi:hypothetical protein
MVRLSHESDPWLQMGLSRSARRDEVNRTYRQVYNHTKLYRIRVSATVDADGDIISHL